MKEELRAAALFAWFLVLCLLSLLLDRPADEID